VDVLFDIWNVRNSSNIVIEWKKILQK